MNKNTQRWTEIKFATLCYSLYSIIRQYPLVVEYIELLADMAKVPREQAIKELQNVTQKNRIAPSALEYISLAREHKETIETTIQTLCISKKTYFKLLKTVPTELYVSPQYSIQDVEIMLELIKAHKTLKGIKI